MQVNVNGKALAWGVGWWITGVMGTLAAVFESSIIDGFEAGGYAFGYSATFMAIAWIIVKGFGLGWRGVRHLARKGDV